MNDDPDGISFFIEGRLDASEAASAGSVFGAIGSADLDRMFAVDGQAEQGISVLPADIHFVDPAGSVADAPAGLAHRDGQGDWRRDFILNGPPAKAQDSPRAARSTFRSLLGSFRRKDVMDVVT